MAEQKTIEIPEAFIKSLHSCTCMPDVKREIETHFPQLFEAKLEPGLYRDEAGVSYILFLDIDGDYRIARDDGTLLHQEDGHSYFVKQLPKHITELRQIMSGLRRVE